MKKKKQKIGTNTKICKKCGEDVKLSDYHKLIERGGVVKNQTVYELPSGYVVVYFEAVTDFIDIGYYHRGCIDDLCL